MLAAARDALAVLLLGGVRVRVQEREGQLEARVRGRTPGPTPERIRREVLELAPGPGAVHLQHDGAGRWRIRGAGALADPRFLQRLRNVLGNA